MVLKYWSNERIKRLTVVDIALIKISVMGFTLMVAKLWEPILMFEWYWYALIFIVMAIILFVKVFKNESKKNMENYKK